jgi:hypothetical protein
MASSSESEPRPGESAVGASPTTAELCVTSKPGLAYEAEEMGEISTQKGQPIYLLVGLFDEILKNPEIYGISSTTPIWVMNYNP